MALCVMARLQRASLPTPPYSPDLNPREVAYAPRSRRCCERQQPRAARLWSTPWALPSMRSLPRTLTTSSGIAATVYRCSRCDRRFSRLARNVFGKGPSRRRVAVSLSCSCIRNSLTQRSGLLECATRPTPDPYFRSFIVCFAPAHLCALFHLVLLPINLALSSNLSRAGARGRRS